MNILIAYSNFYPKIGGGETYIDNLGNTFCDLGHNVTILTRRYDLNLKKIEKFGRLKVIRYEIGNESEWPENDFNDLSMFLNTNKFIFDLIVCRSIVMMEALKNKFNSPIVCIPPCINSVILSTLNLKNIKTLALEKRAFNAADYIAVNSNMLKKQVETRTTKKVIVIKPGFDKQEFKLEKNNITQPDLHKMSFTVLSVGRLSSEKNFLAIPRIAKLINNFLPDNKIEFVIVGDGPELELIKSKSNKLHIRFEGLKTNIAQYMQSADVLLLPSTYESFGFVLIEAMACGLPCLAFKPSIKYLTASAEIINNGKNGLLLKDESEMARAIIDLSQNKSKMKQLIAGTQIRLNQYDWKLTATKILKLAGFNT